MSTNLKIAYPDITFNAVSVISSETYDTDYPVSNLISGSRANIARLATELIGQHEIEFDLGSGVEQAADYVALVNAKRLKGAGVDYVRLRGSDYSYQYPTSMLAIFDPERDVTYDSAMRISQVSDQSGNTNHATQSTDANKPLLSRADNKENLFLGSELFSGDWTDSGADWAANVFIEDSTNGYHARYQTLSVVSGTSYKITAWMKAKERTIAFIWANNNAGGVRFNLSTGAVDGTYGSAYTGTIEAAPELGADVYKCTVTASATSTGSLHYGIGIYNGSNTYLGNGTSGIYLYKAQFRHSTTDDDYINGSTFRQHAGINGNRVMVFDGSNDYLLANGVATALSGSDKPFTLFAVVKQTLLKDWSQLFDLGSGGTPTHRFDLGTSGNTWQYRRDDAATLISLGGSGSSTDLKILTIRFTGTTADLYVDGNSVYTGSAADVTALTVTRFAIGINSDFASYPINGKIAFMAVASSALGTTDREAWEGYLTNRFSTTPLADIDLQNVTLTGGQGKDYIETFTESDAFRYWIAQFITNTASSKRELSKLYFGKLFDMGRDPQLGMTGFSNYHQDKGMHHYKNLSMSYKGVTTSKRQEFESKIGQYKDTNEILLHTTSYDAPLLNTDLLSVQVRNAVFQMHGASQNDLNIDIEESY